MSEELKDAIRVKRAPDGRSARPFVMPEGLGGKLGVWRYIILRRLTQVLVLLLFFGTAHWGWKLFGAPLLTGNLSGSEFVGLIPMADPFAVLQQFLTGHVLAREALIGAGLVLAFYLLLGGRVFCAWVCPINMVTDLAGWLRKRLGLSDVFRLSRDIRYTVLVLALVLSALTGLAAFEWISPISMLHRELLFSAGMGWTAVLGVFLLDLFVIRHGWCGHLCPLGAFYALAGARTAQWRVAFNNDTCTRCTECTQVCPEPQVFNFKKAEEAGLIASGECSNCGRCIPVCPEGSLRFDLRPRIAKPASLTVDVNQPHRRTA